jgi:hypothetical protein
VWGNDPRARCLDGTSLGLFIHQGKETDKFLIFFDGRGYCSGTTSSEILDDCYQFTNDQRGSSQFFTSYHMAYGIFSTDPEASQFASWTKVILMSCDGAMFQGSANDPIKYKDKQLYFRGSDNVKSHFKWLLDNTNFANAQKVVLAGTSSGGAAAYLWSNYAKSLLADPEVVDIVVDSGAYMNISSFASGSFLTDQNLRLLYQISNQNVKTPLESCNKYYEGEEYKCFFLENAYPFVESRLILINSEYDAWNLRYGMDLECFYQEYSG